MPHLDTAWQQQGFPGSLENCKSKCTDNFSSPAEEHCQISMPHRRTRRPVKRRLRIRCDGTQERAGDSSDTWILVPWMLFSLISISSHTCLLGLSAAPLRHTSAYVWIVPNWTLQQGLGKSTERRVWDVSHLGETQSLLWYAICFT